MIEDNSPIEEGKFQGFKGTTIRKDHQNVKGKIEVKIERALTYRLSYEDNAEFFHIPVTDIDQKYFDSGYWMPNFSGLAKGYNCFYSNSYNCKYDLICFA